MYIKNICNIQNIFIKDYLHWELRMIQCKQDINHIEGGLFMIQGKETKREKFVRLAEARTNKIIDMLQLLGNCSNLSTYEYTQQDVDKIFSSIEMEVREAKKKFNKLESQKGSRFTLR